MYRKLFVAALLSLAAFGAQAAMYMHIVKIDGTIKVLNVDDVDRLTFSNGTMTAVKGGSEVASVAMKMVDFVMFDESSSVADVESDAQAALTLGRDGMLLAGGAGTLEVYNLRGEKVIAIPGIKAGSKVDLSDLEKGMYVVKLGRAVRKFSVK